MHTKVTVLRWGLVLVALLLLLWTTAGQAAVYYVDGNGGNDSNSCSAAQNEGSAKATLSGNPNSGIHCITAGDTLYLRGGFYANQGAGQADPPAGTGVSWSQPVIVASYPGEIAHIGGNLPCINFYIGMGKRYWIFDRLYCRANVGDGGIQVVNDAYGEDLPQDRNHHIRWQNGWVDGSNMNAGGPVEATFLIRGNADNFEIKDSEVWGAGGGASGENCLPGYGCYGMYYAGHEMVVDGNIFRHNSGWGIQQYLSGFCQAPEKPGNCDVNLFFTKNNSIFRNNLAYGNGFHDDNFGYGIAFGSGVNNHVYNNVLAYNAGGLSFYNCKNCRADNNTIIGNSLLPGIELGGFFAFTEGSIVKNNIVANNAQNIVNFQDQDDTPTFQDNLCNTSGFGCTNVGNPMLVAPASPTCPSSTVSNPIPVTLDRRKACTAGFLLMAGSPAIDQGVTIADFNTDFAGEPRVQGGTNWEIGAFAYLEGGPGPGPTPTGNPIYLSQGGHGDTPSDGDGSVQSCIDAENPATPKATQTGVCPCMTVPGKELRIRGSATPYPWALDTLTCPFEGGTGWPTATVITAHQNEPVTLELPAGLSGPVALWFRNSGTDHYILVKKVTIDAANRVDSNAIALAPGVHHLRFEDVAIKNTVNGFELIFIHGANNIEFTSTGTTPTTVISNAGNHCLTTFGTVDGLTLDRVELHTCPQRHVNLHADANSGSHTNVKIVRSILRNGGSPTYSAVTIGPGTGAVIQNNLIYSNVNGIDLLPNSIDTKVQHNNISKHSGFGFRCTGPGSVTIGNNIFWQNVADSTTTAGCSLNQQANLNYPTDLTDPLFTNLSANIFTLQDQSPAINAGTEIPGIVVSYDGEPRKQGLQVDLGAYERGSTGEPPPPTMGPLSAHGTNGRYFMKPNGAIVFLTGAYDWNFFSLHMPDAEAIAYLDFWASTGQNLIRAPTWDPAFETPASNPPFNEDYFSYITARTALAKSKNMYVLVPIFGHVNQAPFTSMSYNESYAQHLIDVLGNFDNVLFEVGNELNTQTLDGGTSGSFANHMIDVMKTRQVSNGMPLLPVGFSEVSFTNAGIPPAMLNGPADFIIPGGNAVPTLQDTTVPGDYGGAKVVFVDSDHLWPYGMDHRWSWRVFMRGNAPMILDGNEFHPDFSEDDAGNPSAPTFDARMRIGDIRTYANKLNLVTTTPQGGLSNTGYVLATPGVEYLVYQPDSGAFTVTLQAGTYTREWFDAATQTVVPAANVVSTGPGTPVSMTPPFSGDAVLLLQAVPVAPEPPLVSQQQVPTFVQSWAQ